MLAWYRISRQQIAPRVPSVFILHTSGGAGRNNCTVETSLCHDVDLDGGISSRVVDGSCVDLGDRHGDYRQLVISSWQPKAQLGCECGEDEEG